MSSSVQISAETVERLRDEAYVEVCRQAFARELEQLLESKNKLEQTRPPFGLLGSKKTLEAFEQSRRTTEQSIATIRDNALLLPKIEAWLGGRIKEGLDRYLAEASADQQVYNRIVVRVDRWQATVSALRDNALAFARDLKAVTNSESEEKTFTALVSDLRATTMLLHAAIARPAALAEEVVGLLASVRLPTTAHLPELPQFRDVKWVEHLAVAGLAKSAKELAKAEAEARAFCATGKNELIMAAEHTRAAALKAGQIYLDKYWQQLREYSLKNYVKPRDHHEVFNDLKTRFFEAEKQLMHENLTRSPFAMER